MGGMRSQPASALIIPHHVCVGLLDFYCSPGPSSSPSSSSASPPLPSPPCSPPLPPLLCKARLLYTASCLPGLPSPGPYFYSLLCKLSCYIPPAASQDSLLRAPTSI